MTCPATVLSVLRFATYHQRTQILSVNTTTLMCILVLVFFVLYFCIVIGVIIIHMQPHVDTHAMNKWCTILFSVFCIVIEVAYKHMQSHVELVHCNTCNHM